MRSPGFNLSGAETGRLLFSLASICGLVPACSCSLLSAFCSLLSAFSPNPSKHWAQNPPGLSAGMAVPHSLHLLPELISVLYLRDETARATSSQVAAFHSRSVLSMLPLARVFPSGEKASER